MAMKRPYKTPDHGRAGSDYGSAYEQREYLKKNSRRIEQVMRQFVDGPQGNSQAYLEGWERTFGKKDKAANG